MRAHDVAACLLFNEPNIRYATGASAMPVYAMSTFVRCAVVPQEGEPILFEHANSVHRSRRRAPDVRPMHAWEFFDDPVAEADAWAEVTVAALRELGVTGDLVAMDRAGTAAFLALGSRGIRIRDSGPVTQHARQVKGPVERSLFDLNAPVIEAAPDGGSVTRAGDLRT
jgi:Xaa-Pro aminopeptidase